MGPLIILSGPSGSGKSTVTRRLLKEGRLPLRLSVSATTRPRREGEQEGVEYYFLTRDRFEGWIAAGVFLEWAEYAGNLYGTLRSEVDRYRVQGLGVLLEIEVKGAEQVRRKCPDSVSIFLCAPSWEVLERRLRDRHTEGEAAIARRLDAARAELARKGEFDHVVINDDLDAAVARVRALIAPHFTEGGETCSTSWKRKGSSTRWAAASSCPR
jgi:guanylate kinase